ncbi:hypothetical protein GUITHDRAFT_163003 [Guillardia theta CCMP2712]|uniref:C2 domain-containing protein n=1 Tax=Guillardia theta (strain CCMP2712) TaxID=905079 RepID=L1JD06_GUITC|nr:hypothetical protein GUITHDRAFT_163003 [Guillardia theta CCMP2712]EKX46192.1 hypothetical protein GUITHDRAFT_163003 [Guillardia theta CCMP2712]|eukprot:XP_005833172.1 hypothetical protein GUITHDRAFT_163003 [Guillardia theta CCMP2712]
MSSFRSFSRTAPAESAAASRSHSNRTSFLPKIETTNRPSSFGDERKKRRRNPQAYKTRDVDVKPDWVAAPSDELNDIAILEEKFRTLHARESNALERRLNKYFSQHKTLVSRQAKSTPLVVCVLDKFASSGGLLRTTSGQEVSFALQVKYSFAGHLGEGGEDLRSWVDSNGGFSCILVGPTTIAADVVYKGSGTYFFFYTPILAGSGDVPGSPFESVVEPGKTETTSCTASGMGLLCSEAGVESQFVITSRDKHGNQRFEGGDRYDVTLSGPVTFNAHVTDLNNGQYIAKYNTIMCGDYYVMIKREGQRLAGCPFVLSVVAGKTHGPSCTAVGEGLKVAFAGEDAQFVIEARDIIGNQRVVGNDPFEVEIEGPSTPQISVYDRDDGTYLVTYNVEAVGQYHTRVFLGELQISGSPFTQTVLPGKVVAVRCTGAGRGLTRAFAGEEASFTIESRDINRNKTSSGAKEFLVTVRGVISPQVHCIAGENGEFHYSYRTARAGTYFVSVLYEGVDIGGSPFKLTVDPGPTHANGCSAAGPGITGGYTGIETSFMIHARDYYGNSRTSGGDIFNVEIGGTASARSRIRDNENGTYTVAYTPEIGGDYYISVKHGGIDIQGSPFTVSSDPMPREAYLEMYRSMEPDFTRNLQAQLLDQKSPAKPSRKAPKQGGNADYEWKLDIKLIGGKELLPKDTVSAGTYGTAFIHSSDPYVVMSVGPQQVKSQTIQKNLNPEWNETLTLKFSDRMNDLNVEVFDEDVNDDDDLIGKAKISLMDLVEDKPKMITAKLRDFDSSGKDKGIDCGTIQMILTLQRTSGYLDDRRLR